MSKLLDIAQSWVGTPHVNGAAVKHAGVDCCTLPAQIYKELGIIDIPIKNDYSNDWFCRNNCEELMFPYLDTYFKRVQTLQTLDLISYSWGRAKFAHLALYLGAGAVIHAQANIGVEVTDLDNPYFYYANGRTRATGIWRLKNVTF